MKTLYPIATTAFLLALLPPLVAQPVTLGTAVDGRLETQPGSGTLPARPAADASPSSLSKLQILDDRAPVAHFFRSPERIARHHEPYEQWAKTFDSLMGIQGKALAEESADLYPGNLAPFTRFKQDHPGQAVLLHMNGNARDPRFQSGEFFAGHWLYYNGARILADVPAAPGETDIVVSDHELFRLNTGLKKNKHEDIGLCLLDASGRPNWHQAEQVQLLAINPASRTIRVRRGQFGTEPRAFPAGRAYAAAHAHEGPWDGPSHLMWFYNFSTLAPRDARGRMVANVLSDDIAKRFAPGGELAAFDGLEFDVLWAEPLYDPDLRQQFDRRRGPDCDADGRIDDVFIGPTNTYGNGVIEFLRLLRKKMGDQKLIMADGGHDLMQRGFGLLNGIESEGWPSSHDAEYDLWSAGLDRFWFWQVNSRAPHFNYIRHGQSSRGPWGQHRLAIAGAVFTGSGFSAFAGFPLPEAGEGVGVFDELRQGTEGKIGWLGRPKAPPKRLATLQPDLLQGAGQLIGRELLERFRSDDARIELDGPRLKIAARDPTAASFRFRLTGLPVTGPDLFVQVTVRAGLPAGAPPEIARIWYVGAGSGDIIKPCRTPWERWQRSHRVLFNQGLQGWINGNDFTSGFYFKSIKGTVADVEFEVESAEPIWISQLAAYSHPDAMYREYEHGLVLANPSNAPYDFDLAQIAPNGSFRRLRGSSKQDPQTNNGALVSRIVTLAPKDALFLVQQ